MTGAQRVLQKYGKGAGASALAPKTNYSRLYYYEEEKRRQEEEKNKGDPLDGVGYVAEKLGLGFMQGIEGVWDYTVGGVSSLLGEIGVDGAQDYAERQMANDWMNYNHADEWYNPSEGWKFAGDVAGGIGTSLPSFLVTLGLAWVTGGSSLAVQAAGLGVAGLSAAGTATKEAYQESGELGGKEYGYGAIMGGVEAGTEYLTGKVLGTGLRKTADIATSMLGKNAQSVAKTIGKSAAFGVAKEFASEAFEEGFSEFISPYMKRLTYDPNAETATAEEIGYAALVGGLSGVIMGGAQTIGARGINTVKGAKEIKSGNVESIRAEGKVFAEEGFMKEDYAETVRSIESQLKALEGNESGLAKLKRARLVGELKMATTNGVLSGMVQRSGMTVIENAEAVAERLNADGRYKMVDGRFTFVENTDAIPEGADVRDITAEDLTKGYDSANGKDAMAKALKKNEALRYVAASDAAGRFMMTAKESADAALRGEKIRNEAEYKRLRESASAEERAAMSRELGVDVNTASFEQFNEAVGQFKESGRADAYKQKTAKIGEIKAKANDRAYNMPKAIALADGGVKRFSDADNNIAVARMGDSFIIYDYNTGLTTRNMTRAEVNAELARYRNERTKAANARAEAQKNATTETAAATGQTVTEGNTEGASDIWEKGVTEADRKAATEARKQAAELDSYAKEKIKDYDHLSAANKTMVRDVIREARAKGLSDADALSYARVAARTGLDIQFSEKECYNGKNEAGEDVYHAGFYDPENNRIVINPKTTKKHTVLLIHELSHAMRSYRTKGGEVKYFIDEDAKVSDALWKEIKKYYADENGKVDAALALDEASAYYAEALFGTEGAIDLLLGEKPTLRQKILSFFTKSAAYYSTDEKLSREARRHFKKFKAMFDAFADRNAGRNAEVVNEIIGKSARRFSMAGTNAATADHSRLITAREMIADGKDSETVRKETGWFIGYDGRWRFEIDDSVAEWHLDAAKPDSKRLFNFGERIFKLTDLLDHPELYKAYPQLKDVTVWENPEAKISGYVVGRSTDAITVRSLKDTDINKDILIHEIQHLIQNIEGFASGASIDQFSYKAWGEKEFAAYEKRNEIASKLYAILRRHGVSIPKADADAVRTAFEVRDSIIDYNFMLIESLADNNARTRNLLDQYYAQVQILNLTTPEGQYHAVPGEVEAYDVQARRRMTAEERKNTRPNIDREDVVFAGGNDVMQSIGVTTDGRRVVVVNDDVLRNVHGKNQEIAVVKKALGRFKRVPVHKQSIYITGDTANEVTRSKSTETLRKKDVVTYKDKMRVMNHPVDIVMATTDYVNEAPKHPRKDDIVDFARGTILLQVHGRQYSAEAVYGYTKKGVCRLHDVVQIQPATFEIKKSSESLSHDRKEAEYRRNESLDTISISQSVEKSTDSAKKVAENSRRASAETIENVAELPRKAERANMTVGQLKKFLANYSRAKTYSRKDALGVVEKIDAGKALNESTRNDIAEAVWQIYNEAMTTEERYAAAQDIANYFTLKLFAESKIDNPDAKKAQEDLVYLSAGIGSLSFTEQQKNEIKHREDADGLKSIIGRWGFKGERTRKNGTIVKRTPLDVFVVDIAREMPGMQYLEDMNPVDAFLQINQVYTATREIALDKQMSAYWDVPESEIEVIKTSIENDIMQGYIDSGTKSKFASMFQSRIAFYEKQAERYKNEFNEIRGRDKINGMLVSQALKMRDLKIGKFKNATQTQSDTFKKTIESLARIQWRGNISVKSTRKVVKDLYEWYVNPDVKKAFFGYVDENNPGRYNEGIAALMQELSKDESKKFTKIDLYAMLDVMGYFTNFVETYGKVYRRGQWVDAEAEAKAFIEKIPTAAQKRRGIGNATKTLADKYLGAFGDPASYIRRMDNYSDGFFTQIYEELRDAAISSDAQEIDLLVDYDEFISKNKKYLEKAKTETVEYKGFKIPKIHLIGLYMTMKQQQAHAGIAINGFAFVDTDGKEVRVPGGIKQEGEVTEQDIKAYIEEQQKTIEKSLTEADREYIKVVEKGYLAAGQAKAYRDMQKYGFTNVVNDYYYPIKRANIASNVDKSDIQEELDRVSNASFNKDRVKGAKQELFIDDADKLYRRHIHAVCQYANLSPVIDSYNMLYNYDIAGNPNHPTSIRTQSRNVWAEAHSYFMKLISDVQGITHGRGVGMEAIARIRSGYARYQLGANPKTWVTQISSIFAASSLIDSRRVLTPISGKDVDKYCALARIRNYDNAAVKAQAVADSKIRAKTDSIGDALMKPIGAVDRFVIQRLFAACQSQVEADGGAKVGTEENKIAAGKLLTRVILETQQNSIATERSAAMRSDNEIVRSLTMFRADAMKVIGRVIDSYGEVKTLSRQLKATRNADTVAELKGKLKKAKKKAAKSMRALATTSIYTALIAQLFKWLYAKERDEDESLAEDFITDVIGNAIGGLPLITDAYSYFVEGFDLDNYSYSAINDFLASAKSIFELADGDFTDEELARNIKNLSYSVGQIFGIPTRNIYNIFYGLTKRISPETGYAIDSVFYEKNYKNDFYKAIEQGDDDMANYILQLLMGERIGDGIGEESLSTILDLSNKGYKILPKSVPDSVTVDGVEYDLGEDDIASVKALYGEYAKGIDDLVKSSYYANLSDEKRCEAISYYYDLSRDKAIYDALGYDRGSKVKIADLVGMENLVKLQIATKGIESDKDRDGNTVAGSKRAKVVKAIKSIKGTRTEKVLMIYVAGYTVKDGDIPGVSEAAAKKMLLSAIMKLKVSKEEKAEIARSFGFTVKGNRIVRDF